KEDILIFGDYDADGIISASLIYNFLKKLDLNAEVYIPDRFNEGYDLRLDFFKKISMQSKYDLIICVDCGTNSAEVQKFIQDSPGPDVIVCDHHNQSADFDVKQDNYIIINPMLKGSRYPFKYLSGAGVTFKFIISILRELDEDYKKKFKKDYLTNLLDLVAISTIADIMPLVDENRVMVKKGLKMLNKTVNPGLKKMINAVIKDKKNISEYDIGFIIAPRLNAAGRIKNAESSFNLLSKEGDILDKIINDLNSFNEERKNIQKDILNEIIKNNDFDKIVKEKKIFIDKSKNWNEGVLGIVASDIVKRFNIPAILFKEIKGKLKGSGRSTDKFDLYGNLVSLGDLFENFGGHRLACGISMNVLNFKTFYKKMLEIADKNIKDRDIEKIFAYDLELYFRDINKKILNEINLLKPFGAGNPEPSFTTGNCAIIDFYYLMEERHVKLKLKQSGRVFDAIMFKIDKRVKEKVVTGNKINILYKIEENIWGDFRTIQLVILDLF
ncbi:MAG: single-stranded-DNA-specific exonuclease RecJ, partial [Actinobacteria bacterium]|nr:single-stranded-DNA-specific exonuclease RecJ [Actinomycetota bacterium]